MHAGPLTHVQEVLDVTLVHNDVHGHLPLEASVQQVLEDIYVSEHVHDHSYHLGTEKDRVVSQPSNGDSTLLLPRCKSVKNLAPVLLKVDGVGRRAECRKAGDLRAGARSLSQLHVSRPLLRASFLNQVGIH